jgi:hypothetical protein
LLLPNAFLTTFSKHPQLKLLKLEKRTVYGPVLGPDISAPAGERVRPIG